ncbi:uncharacterized protein Nmag_2377 [Natrialba magadii ATCC 43099]|uniref:DUF7260 domain-containing protein n=1 Tax=Natrialba magadii (strain ATCC 43099 / DSM 3394 / CCM 3739 / CIP 104546 / IAM 13178 / JCM 8861 / NBRC 102185 / NCIMB 2190 / MS3) TaxID=547559 RepID=D3SXI9_NATMM|nr:hypothetical protein [Natrialba magadii]ADD05938.1 uncharacterized protein Nmag_2377 [Natrialba magadii ATCC 43099]ELY30554.1 hypothetical protein C500_08532 [Natrialba magadii ATCC 43099]
MTEPAPLRTIDAARRVIDREHEVLIAEKRAFDRFNNRLQALDANGSAAGSNGSTMHVSGTATKGLSRVRTLYEETIMNVPHYEDSYDESLSEHVAGEFSAELAAALESHSVLTPQLKQPLLEMSGQSVTLRHQLIEAIEREREAVDSAGRELRAIQDDLDSILTQPLDSLEFNALRLSRGRLLELQRACDESSAKRQDRIRRRRELTIGDIGMFEAYLYADCEHTYPVLAACATMGTRVRQGRHRLERLLAVVQ